MIDETLDPSDIVISSRIRLARNIAEYPFITTCSDDQRAQIESAVRAGLTQDDELSQLNFVDSKELEMLEHQFLMELQLVSRETDEPSVDTEVSKAELIAQSGICVGTMEAFEEVSLSINEEDHLRLTITRNDLDLHAAWDQLSSLDDKIEQQLNYAYNERWGYLTACPANVGTGMRVSVMLHLPALVLTEQVDKVFRSLQRVNVVARGVFGEKAAGDFFRISNQATLGRKESDLIDQVSSVIPSLIKYERQARTFLLKENREGLRRDVNQALSELCKVDLGENDADTKEQTLTLLSRVRMGVAIGLLGQKDVDQVNRMFALFQLRHQLNVAIDREDYQAASALRDEILKVESGQSS
ncbi:MAG: ATP--guanido phosphotransferase [Mariniblastus sp.]